MPKQSVFKALADPNRRRIIALLRKHDTLNAGQIAAQFDISAPAVSEHLRLLLHAGLIGRERHGRHIHYHLNTSIFEEIITYFMQLADHEGGTASCESNHSQ